jgi:hypothetical protein
MYNTNYLIFKYAIFLKGTSYIINLRVGCNVYYTMKISSLIIILLFISCTDIKPKKAKHTLDFGSFTIETPSSWTKIRAKGIDSYVGKIAIDSNETLYFDLGWYSNTLTEDEPQIVERSLLQHMSNTVDTSDLIIVDSRNGIDPDKYKRNNISWDTIDGRKAKIVSPIRSGIGTTGIYIDSLWQAGSDIDRFNLYGNNLKPANEKSLLEALKTLRFHKEK